MTTFWNFKILILEFHAEKMFNHGISKNDLIRGWIPPAWMHICLKRSIFFKKLRSKFFYVSLEKLNPHFRISHTKKVHILQYCLQLERLTFWNCKQKGHFGISRTKKRSTFCNSENKKVHILKIFPTKRFTFWNFIQKKFPILEFDAKMH